MFWVVTFAGNLLVALDVSRGGLIAGVPLDIVRGISNTAGDRDTAHWQGELPCGPPGGRSTHSPPALHRSA